jgi:hypothetical protein
MSLTPQEQHRRLAALQHEWHTDAVKDADYNLRQAQVNRKKGNLVLAAGYMQEYRWDNWWGNRRETIAERERRLSGKK